MNVEEVTAKIKEILKRNRRFIMTNNLSLDATQFTERLMDIEKNLLEVLEPLRQREVKLRELIENELITKVCCVQHAPDIWFLLKKNQELKEKLEGLLKCQK